MITIFLNMMRAAVGYSREGDIDTLSIAPGATMYILCIYD